MREAATIAVFLAVLGAMPAHAAEEQVFIRIACQTIDGKSNGCTWPPPRYVFKSAEECRAFIARENFPAREGIISYTVGCATKTIQTWEPAE